MPSGISSMGETGRKIEDTSPKYFVELALLLDKAMVSFWIWLELYPKYIRTIR